MNGNKAIEKARKEKIILANKYNVSISSIVWMGGNRYIIVKNGQEIII